MNDHELKELINKPKRAHGEFRVGDVVACHREGVYSYTNVGVKCRVVDTVARGRQGEMRVEIISNNERWIVRKEYFELLEESQA